METNTPTSSLQTSFICKTVSSLHSLMPACDFNISKRVSVDDWASRSLRRNVNNRLCCSLIDWCCYSQNKTKEHDGKWNTNNKCHIFDAFHTCFSSKYMENVIEIICAMEMWTDNQIIRVRRLLYVIFKSLIKFHNFSRFFLSLSSQFEAQKHQINILFSYFFLPKKEE